MILPIPITNPAKFMFTFLTIHVITPLILLNPRPTIRTRFRIRQNPIRSLRFILTLLLPTLQRSTIQRLMRLIPALDAKLYQARITVCNNIIRIAKNPRAGLKRGDPLTPWTGTPPGCSIDFDEISQLIGFEFFQ
mmetsp:Transcript_13857/g.20786  ORF Transcript_13857/g.20786 Transcript_13857/m.20786 type:complete len:135 (+) Transcript_13857:712-1116(+)